MSGQYAWLRTLRVVCLNIRSGRFLQQLKDNDGIAVVPISYCGNGIHMKEGWVLTDARLCGTAVRKRQRLWYILIFLSATEQLAEPIS